MNIVPSLFLSLVCRSQWQSSRWQRAAWQTHRLQSWTQPPLGQTEGGARKSKLKIGLLALVLQLHSFTRIQKSCVQKFNYGKRFILTYSTSIVIWPVAIRSRYIQQLYLLSIFCSLSPVRLGWCSWPRWPLLGSWGRCSLSVVAQSPSAWHSPHVPTRLHFDPRPTRTYSMCKYTILMRMLKNNYCFTKYMYILLKMWMDLS